MSLDKEAREFNERQKRYQEQEWQHKHMAGADHREMMAVLNKIENGLGFLIDALTQWMEDREEQRKADERRSSYGLYDPQKYRTQRSGGGISGDAVDMPEDRPPYRNPYRNRRPFDQGIQDGGEDPHLK
jgi:hypothetical protein